MSKTLKIVIFSVIGAVVICCGGGSAAFFLVLNSSTKAPKAATGDFLSALEGGNNQAAYKLLCASTQKSYGPETFEAYVQKNQPVSHDLDWGGSYYNSNGHETASISGTVTYKNGASNSHEFSLVKESGSWKVCGNPY
ncbi:Rv0361 family membrane protein [Dactylosporangium sp. CA-233914]|uniref:Rv0361 family membrane protein n=1 Tax=Dactylosporangium sp. CA-233914 TaxID=3239934 RepID=UPI003D91D076